MTKKSNFVPAAVKKRTHNSILEIDKQQEDAFSGVLLSHADIFDAGVELIRREFDKTIKNVGGNWADTVAAHHLVEELVAAANRRQFHREYPDKKGQ